MEYDHQHFAYQGFLDYCNYVWINKAELQEPHAPLKPSIIRPEMEYWERTKQYFGHVPADTVRRTFKHATQIGTLPPSSNLQRQFKSPNPALNIHRQSEADTTGQIFTQVPAMAGGDTSAHIFVG